MFIPYLIKFATNDNVLVRQPACYGLGISARCVNPALVGPYCNAAIQALITAVSREDAREEINNPCTDNAISSIGKYIQYQGPSGVFDANELVPIFFNLLPLVEDITEGPNVYGLLCTLIERYPK
jgi:hypothetical protein